MGQARWMGAQALALVAVSVCGAGVSARAQVVKAPRYQGGMDAPTPQLNLPPLPAAITPNGTVVEDVVVRVNDQIISRSDVERAEQQLQQDAAQTNMPAGDLALRQRDMLRDMIDQQLLLSRAKELGLNADADVIRRLDDIRKQNKLESLDDLEKAARQQGVSFEDFKAQIRNQILTQQVVRDEVGRRLQLSQADEDRYYAEHKNEFEQPEQVRLSEILVPLAESANAAQIAQAEDKANALKTQVMQGKDFAELAKTSSGGPSAAQGGELGLFKRGALAKVLEDQTFGLKPGESTQPIRTRQGFVILKVTEHLASGPAPLKEVEPQIQEALYMQAMQPALRAYLTKRREDSYIDLQPGFVDSGSTTRETKPVFTAYAPPAVKKKTVKDKGRFDRHGYENAAVTRTVSKPVVASPDTTGTRTLTGKDAAPLVDPQTGLAMLTPTKASAVAANAKPKKLKKEKIRFGQAPRTALPPGEEETAVGTDVAAAPTSTTAQANAAQEAANAQLEANALAPAPAPLRKARFAAKSQEVKQQKTQIATAKQQEKSLATPVAASTEEKADQNQQSTALGLNGDQGKKKPKVKREKGAPKVRLQEKAPEKPKEETPVDQTANPALAPTAATPPSHKDSTAPPATPPQN